MIIFHYLEADLYIWRSFFKVWFFQDSPAPWFVSRYLLWNPFRSCIYDVASATLT